MVSRHFRGMDANVCKRGREYDSDMYVITFPGALLLWKFGADHSHFAAGLCPERHKKEPLCGGIKG